MLRSGVVVRWLLLLGYGGVFRFGFDLFLTPKEMRGVEWIVQDVGVCGWNGWNGWNYLWDVVIKVVFMGLD